MRLIGNIQQIKNKRDSKNQEIELHVDRVEYITYKKDGKYFQPFNLMQDLETPLIITGDCLARIEDKNLQEGETDFKVYDKEEDDYVLNENKQLSIMMEYDEEANLPILSSVEYSVTVSNDEFRQLRSEVSKEKKQKKGRR